MSKRRSDRNHVIYRLTMETGDDYIGLTVSCGQAFLRSVKLRVQKHLSRARCEHKEWALYRFLRENKDVAIEYEILEVVRGRKPAHQQECKLIRELTPSLNTFGKP